MDHNYVRDEENEEEILRGIWENVHPDAGGEDADNGTNVGNDDDDFTSQFLICGEGLDSTERNDEVPIY